MRGLAAEEADELAEVLRKRGAALACKLASQRRGVAANCGFQGVDGIGIQPREVGIVNGISDNLYAFDVESGTILWQKHWSYTAPASASQMASANPDPAHLGEWATDPGTRWASRPAGTRSQHPDTVD